MLGVNICECVDRCVCKAGELSKNQVIPWIRAASAAGSDLSPSENSSPKAKAEVSQAAAPLTHSWGLDTSTPEGKKQKTSFPQEPPQPTFPLKKKTNLLGCSQTPKLPLFFAQSPQRGREEELPWKGAGLAHPQGDWESSGSISWKRPWIHSEGSACGVGNVLNQRHSRALPAHTPNSWDIYFPKSSPWMAEHEGCEGLVGKKSIRSSQVFLFSPPRFRKGEICSWIFFFFFTRMGNTGMVGSLCCSVTPFIILLGRGFPPNPIKKLGFPIRKLFKFFHDLCSTMT